ncbi:RHS repeat-associated core domain-containing protein [Ostreibacterium oceani]|uniref:RHS repeat-associated protein n=1 Tax=Ostreibacterium oceani TaxID=2654998 RepID=A0A6N7EYA0_9GAMM|nr:hypothetical protein [Ostreibacterium oceani]
MNLYQNYHRDYNPNLGRYLQTDPIGLAGGMNRYGYAGQSPLVFTDALGLSSCEGKWIQIGDSIQRVTDGEGGAYVAGTTCRCFWQCIFCDDDFIGPYYNDVNEFNHGGTVTWGVLQGRCKCIKPGPEIPCCDD